MYHRSLIGGLFFLQIVFLSLPLQSQISVTEIEGNWTSVTGGTSVTGIGTNEIKWGIAAGEKSSYIFEPSPVIFPVSIDTPFDLGTFTHNNYAIYGSGITGATLTADFTFLIDGTAVSSSMVYDFNHNETANTGPGNCCDDIVTALNNNAFSDRFYIGNAEYQLNITGFEVGGEVFTEFNTKEGESNSATLVAEINRSVNVPEPSTYLLLASLLAFAYLLKRRMAKNKKTS